MFMHADGGVSYDRMLSPRALRRSAALTTAELWAGQGSLTRQSQTTLSVFIAFVDEIFDFEPA
jgi:hypothetical protein